MFAEIVCLTITTTTTTIIIIICLSVLSVWQSAGGWWVNSERERERERESTKLSKWSLVVTLLSWLEFGS
jgi:hypothetical protein